MSIRNKTTRKVFYKSKKTKIEEKKKYKFLIENIVRHRRTTKNKKLIT